MPPKRRTPYVSVNLTVDARNALQRLTLLRSAELERRLSMSAVLVAALAVAERHIDEMTNELVGDQGEGDEK